MARLAGAVETPKRRTSEVAPFQKTCSHRCWSVAYIGYRGNHSQGCSRLQCRVRTISCPTTGAGRCRSSGSTRVRPRCRRGRRQGGVGRRGAPFQIDFGPGRRSQRKEDGRRARSERHRRRSDHFGLLFTGQRRFDRRSHRDHDRVRVLCRDHGQRRWNHERIQVPFHNELDDRLVHLWSWRTVVANSRSASHRQTSCHTGQPSCHTGHKSKPDRRVDRLPVAQTCH